MEVPALGDEGVDIPGVLDVDPVHHPIEPLPHLATQLRVVARGWVPRSGKGIWGSNSLSLVLVPNCSGEPPVPIRAPHPLTDVGEVANPDLSGRPIRLGDVHVSILRLRVRQSARDRAP